MSSKSGMSMRERMAAIPNRFAEKQKEANGDPIKTSAAGPYKSGLKTDQSVGVRQMTEEQKKAAANKPKDGSQFLPKGVPAGNKANTPASKTKPRTKNTYPGSAENMIDDVKKTGKKLYDEANDMIWNGREWVLKDLGLKK